MTNDCGGIQKYIDRLSGKDLVKASYCLLLFWIFTPVVVMILNLTPMYSYTVNIIWYDITEFVGFMGLLVGGIYVQRLHSACKGKISKREELIAFLPFLFLIAFTIWTFICCVKADDRYSAFTGATNPTLNEGFVTYIVYAGFVLLGFVLSNDVCLIKKLAHVFLAIACAVSVLSLSDTKIAHELFDAYLLTNCDAYYGFFYNTNHFSYYLVIAFFVDFFLYVNTNSRRASIIYLSVSVLLTIMLIYNDTMGAYLAFLLGLIFIIVWKFINREDKKGKTFVFFLIFLLVSFFSNFFVPNLYKSFFSMFADLEILNKFFGGFVTEEELGAIGSLRGDLWKNSLKIIPEHPIFGVGLENAYKYFAVYEGHAAHRPHNELLQVLIFTGIPGFVLYMDTHVIGVKRMLVDRKKISPLVEACGFIIVAYWISAFFGLSLFSTTPYYLIVFGICFSGCVNNVNKLYC